MIDILSLKGHTLILNHTNYKKTIINKYICALIQSQIFTAVLDVEKEDWPCDLFEDNFNTFKTKVEHFIKVNKTRALYEKIRKPVFYLFIEEAHEYTRAEARQLKSWAKRIRKYGGKIFFIGQHYIDVEKGIRTECESYIVFKQSPEDIRAVIETTGSKEIGNNCPLLGDGEFFVRYTGHSDIEFMRYSFDKRATKSNGVKVQKVKTIQTEKLSVLDEE